MYWKGRRSEDDKRQINRWKRIVSRFKGNLIKMIDTGGDSPKIRQVLLHWGYELEKQLCTPKNNKYFINCIKKDAPEEISKSPGYLKYCLSHSVFFFLIVIKMSYYYWFNRKELLKKAHEKHNNKGGKEKAALHYQKNEETIKKREKYRYRSMTDIERDEKKRKSLKRYYKLKAQNTE